MGGHRLRALSAAELERAALRDGAAAQTVSSSALMRRLLVLMFVLSGCVRSEDARPSGASATVPASASAPVIAPPSSSAPASASETAQLTHPALHSADRLVLSEPVGARPPVLWVAKLVRYNEELDDDEDLAIAILPGTRARAGARRGRALGVVYEHEGEYRLEHVRDVPLPYRKITLVGSVGVCDAPVMRAVETSMRAYASDGRASSSPAESRVVLFIGSCVGAGNAGTALAGTPVRWRSLDGAPAGPVSPAVAEALRARGAPSALTMVALSAPDTYIVQGDPYYFAVVRGTEILWSPVLAPLAEVVAGGHVFLLCPTAEQEYLRAVDEVASR